ncbi:MAG: PEGA domain-containing protein [candidate division KSB1 bacterium]|nr:PEGA domain-containing protein [candidate division KSB1 bacterium]MDZ7274729.1 PEGA domain-containing protein [candidate division KSB1 bacterium]MDZ7285554.1 PEGA domain-containing protein [candidate division KSB1 bacterium]MDZ7298586.1 PEGA domain-containing protein [candidate division KSB1 bacterium]MDZ7306765.1 PEGA domain-containing protein [candidate division KSB1 bacterium]
MITRCLYPALLFCLINPAAGLVAGALAAVSTTSPGLLVQINNVRDQRNNKGEVELYVEGRRIQPLRTTERTPRNEVFELPLAQGVYQVKAVYRAKSFWKEKEYELQTHDGRVRIYPGHVTLLTITLEKNPDGSLVRKKNFFTESAQPLAGAAGQVTATAPAASPAAAGGHESKPTPEVTPAVRVVPAAVAPETARPPAVPDSPMAPAPALPAPVPPVEPAPVAPPADEKIALQINTIPTHAEVIVDDKYLGQSPLITYISRGQNHVIQISKAGHRDRIKMLEAAQLRSEKIFFLIEKLEPQP